MLLIRTDGRRCWKKEDKLSIATRWRRLLPPALVSVQLILRYRASGYIKAGIKMKHRVVNLDCDTDESHVATSRYHAKAQTLTWLLTRLATVAVGDLSTNQPQSI